MPLDPYPLPPPSPQKLLEMTPDEATLLVPRTQVEAQPHTHTTTNTTSAAENETDEAGFVERPLPTAMLQRGDLCLVKAGERVPCDAVVVRGVECGWGGGA